MNASDESTEQSGLVKSNNIGQNAKRNMLNTQHAVLLRGDSVDQVRLVNQVVQRNWIGVIAAKTHEMCSIA